MSDDEKISKLKDAFNEVIDVQNKKISELEDKIVDVPLIREKLKELEKKFNSLEKRYETKRDTIFRFGELQGEIDEKLNERIEKLEEKYKECNKEEE